MRSDPNRGAAVRQADVFGTMAGLSGAIQGHNLLARPRATRFSEFLEGPGPEGLNLEPLPTRPPSEVFEDHLKIDIRELNQRWLLPPGELTFIDMVWQDLTFDIKQVALAVDRRGERSEVRIAFDRPGRLRVQTFKLEVAVSNNRARPYFVTPSSGQRVEVLAYRFGRFGAPRELRLLRAAQVPGRARSKTPAAG